MSDKLTAYRGEMFSSQQDGEAPQQNYGIDPNTGLPIQSGYAQQPGQQFDQQGMAQGNLGGAADGQTADQTYYQQQDAYQQQDHYQGQDPYQGQQGGFQQQGQYSQADYNQAQYGQQQYSQDQYGLSQQEQAPYSQTDQGLQNYQDPYQTAQQGAAQGQYGQLDQSSAGFQTDYAQQNQGFVEETDPYMAAHQNATLPYDASNDALGQAGHSYGVGHDQHGLPQQYQDPNAGYGDYQQGSVNGLPAPDGLGGAHQQYQDPSLGADYAGQYNAQGVQPLQNNMQPGMIGGAGYGQPGMDAAIAANQADASYDADVQSSGRKSFLVGTMILGSVIIGGGVAFAYKYSGDSTSDNAPVITSEDSGIKSKPDNPGGREFAHQKKQIFARLGDPGAKTEEGIVATREPEVVESLRGEVKDAAGQAQKVRGAADNNGGPRRVRTYRIDRNGNQILDGAANRAQLAGQDVKDMAGVTADTGQPARTVRTLKANGAKKVQDKSIQIARAQAKAPPVRRVASNDGNYVVQISARRTQTDALAAFSGLQSKYGSILGSYRPLIQRADLGSRGIWFRLRVGPMQTREDAASVCAKLKSKGMKNCLVASR